MNEHTFRARLQQIQKTARITDRQIPFVILVLVVLVLGAQYMSADDFERYESCMSRDMLLQHLLRCIETNIFYLFDYNNVDSVTTLLLLASNYLYHQRPSRAFAMVGAAVKSAQAMNLHNELAWGSIDVSERETRRRLWWFLVSCDKYVVVALVIEFRRSSTNLESFISLGVGRPSSIDLNEVRVELPSNSEDMSAACPGFASQEQSEGLERPVTALAYHVQKARLYQIIASMVRDTWFLEGRDQNVISERIREVHSRLIEWERNLPRELCLGNLQSVHGSAEPTEILRIFRLQALALSVSYDNIQINLHRPLLLQNRSIINLASALDTNTSLTVSNDGFETESFSVSRRQCWESALRISTVVEQSHAILQEAHLTPFGAHAGMSSFTAGVTLALFALSDPLGSEAAFAKRGIARIMRVSRSPGHKAAVWAQAASILEDLLRLIAAEELRLLTSDAPEVVSSEDLAAHGTSMSNADGIDRDHTTNLAPGMLLQEHRFDAALASLRQGTIRSSFKAVTSNPYTDATIVLAVPDQQGRGPHGEPSSEAVNLSADQFPFDGNTVHPDYLEDMQDLFGIGALFTPQYH